ncbi:hypothetical protein BDV41DRAFT_519031 [Aspergillus transmontanensis]|uniref:Uncharacterized protein n=1 Tax=Aspergillus transmontanensis TaxID=1034304 RepID=A0A5N6WH12_9EURO|nr:hypothetical protein BDV41DRAFT_519031 [Aspergillus transmontanensis]
MDQITFNRPPFIQRSSSRPRGLPFLVTTSNPRLNILIYFIFLPPSFTSSQLIVFSYSTFLLLH